MEAEITRDLKAKVTFTEKDPVIIDTTSAGTQYTYEAPVIIQTRSEESQTKPQDKKPEFKDASVQLSDSSTHSHVSKSVSFSIGSDIEKISLSEDTKSSKSVLSVEENVVVDRSIQSTEDVLQYIEDFEEYEEEKTPDVDKTPAALKKVVKDVKSAIKLKPVEIKLLAVEEQVVPAIFEEISISIPEIALESLQSSIESVVEKALIPKKLVDMKISPMLPTIKVSIVKEKIAQPKIFVELIEPVKSATPSPNTSLVSTRTQTNSNPQSTHYSQTSHTSESDKSESKSFSSVSDQRFTMPLPKEKAQFKKVMVENNVNPAQTPENNSLNNQSQDAMWSLGFSTLSTNPSKGEILSSFLSEEEIGDKINPAQLNAILDKYFPVKNNTIIRDADRVSQGIVAGMTREEIVEIAIGSGENSFGGVSDDVSLGQRASFYADSISSGEQVPLAIELLRRKKVLDAFYEKTGISLSDGEIEGIARVDLSRSEGEVQGSSHGKSFVEVTSLGEVDLSGINGASNHSYDSASSPNSIQY